MNCVRFSVIRVSQGSVATYVRYGGMSTKRCIANFLLSLSVKEFIKLVKILRFVFGTRCDSALVQEEDSLRLLSQTTAFTLLVSNTILNDKPYYTFTYYVAPLLLWSHRAGILVQAPGKAK